MASRQRKPRKRHIQTELPLKFDKNGQRRGGRRSNAGRPSKEPKGPNHKPGSPHKTRAAVDPRHPQHATMRAARAVGTLRRMDVYRAIRAALTRVAAKHPDFRIVHISIQRTHIHALCEAGDKMALARGLQGFQISAAKALNRMIAKRTKQPHAGKVFRDRYHVESISSVRQTRNALSYVLNNWRRHDEDRGRVGLFDGRVDPFSSGTTFAGWQQAIATWEWPTEYEPPPVCRPQTWLLAQGWRRAKPIGAFEVPGPRARPRPDRAARTDRAAR